MTDNINNTTMEDELPKNLHDFTENKVHSYVKLSDKYADIMSSASTMLLVGGIGIVFMILVFADYINIPLNPETSWLFYSVMGGVFIIFIISGIISFMHAAQVKIDAEAENKLIDEINTWASENLSKEYLDENLDLEQPEEILYFGRSDKIKDDIMHEFENADEALVVELAEQIYQNIYEQ